MISHDFRYEAPESFDIALDLLSSFGSEAAVLGGGTWLVPNMTYGRHRPKVVIDLKNLPLSAITRSGDELVIGARVSYAQVIDSIAVSDGAPLLAKMARQVTGGPQIVGQGTLGGSACYGNPSSDVPACLVALDAKMVLRSKSGMRELRASAFFRAPFVTAKRDDELLAEIRIPLLASERASSAYEKLKFSTGSWPIVTVNCLAMASGGKGLRLKIAVGGANETPFAYEAVISSEPSDEELSDVAQRAAHLVKQEWADQFAGPGYRRSVVPAIVRRALHGALGREPT